MHDPVCGMTVAEGGLTISGYPYAFCSEHCRRAFLASPERFGAELAGTGEWRRRRLSRRRKQP